MNSIFGRNYSIIIIAAVLVVTILIGLTAGGSFALVLLPIMLITFFLLQDSRPAPVFIPIRTHNPSDTHIKRGPPTRRG